MIFWFSRRKSFLEVIFYKFWFLVFWRGEKLLGVREGYKEVDVCICICVR